MYTFILVTMKTLCKRKIMFNEWTIKWMNVWMNESVNKGVINESGKKISLVCDYDGDDFVMFLY